jgi:hypothetical protein
MAMLVVMGIVLVYRRTRQIVMMIMMMRINRHCGGDGFRTEQFQIGRIAGNGIRSTFAANMMVETQHPVCGRHHEM